MFIQKVTYYGIEIDPEKVIAIGKRLKMFIQKVTYYGRFLWELAQELYTLHQMPEQKSKFQWID